MRTDTLPHSTPRFQLSPDPLQWQAACQQPWHQQGVIVHQPGHYRLCFRDLQWSIQPARSHPWSSAELTERIHQGLALALALEDALLVAAQDWPQINEAALARGLNDLHLSRCQDIRDPAPLACAPMNTLDLYAVMPTLDLVEACLQAGLTTVQLRHKGQSRQLANDLDRCRALGEQYQAQVLVNDSWQEGLAAGVYGMHLGQEDCLQADLTAIAQQGCRLGLSTHGFAELLRACRLTPSYVALGHVFSTQTKDMPSQPQGLLRLTQYHWLAQQRGVPALAIGGIKETHFEQLANLGITAIAVVSAISDAQQPQQRAQQLLTAWRHARRLSTTESIQ